MTTALLLRVASILQARPMIAAFALASLAGAILSWRFIFPVPAAFSAVLSACLGLAFFQAL